MEEFIKVWTKQSQKILDDLKKHDIFYVKREYILQKMTDVAFLYLDTYSWLKNASIKRKIDVGNAKYPVWLSLKEEEAIPQEKGDGTVLLELSVPKSKVMIFDLEKWGYIVNYQYLPTSLEDRNNFLKKLHSYGVDDDTTAYMTPFYPHLKKEIIKSWDRLFNPNIRISPLDVGIIWYLEKNWVKKIVNMT